MFEPNDFDRFVDVPEPEDFGELESLGLAGAERDRQARADDLRHMLEQELLAI